MEHYSTPLADPLVLCDFPDIRSGAGRSAIDVLIALQQRVLSWGVEVTFAVTGSHSFEGIDSETAYNWSGSGSWSGSFPAARTFTETYASESDLLATSFETPNLKRRYFEGYTSSNFGAITLTEAITHYPEVGDPYTDTESWTGEYESTAVFNPGAVLRVLTLGDYASPSLDFYKAQWPLAGMGFAENHVGADVVWNTPPPVSLADGFSVKAQAYQPTTDPGRTDYVQTGTLTIIVREWTGGLKQLVIPLWVDFQAWGAGITYSNSVTMDVTITAETYLPYGFNRNAPLDLTTISRLWAVDGSLANANVTPDNLPSWTS